VLPSFVARTLRRILHARRVVARECMKVSRRGTDLRNLAPEDESALSRDVPLSRVHNRTDGRVARSCNAPVASRVVLPASRHVSLPASRRVSITASLRRVAPDLVLSLDVTRSLS
jgi:hypothetical protein